MYYNTCLLKTSVFEKNNGPGGVIMLSRMKKTPVGEVKLPLKNEMIRPFFFRMNTCLLWRHMLFCFLWAPWIGGVRTVQPACGPWGPPVNKDHAGPTARMWAVGPNCEKRPCGPYGPYAVPTARMRSLQPACGPYGQQSLPPAIYDTFPPQNGGFKGPIRL